MSEKPIDSEERQSAAPEEAQPAAPADEQPVATPPAPEDSAVTEAGVEAADEPRAEVEEGAPAQAPGATSDAVDEVLPAAEAASLDGQTEAAGAAMLESAGPEAAPPEPSADTARFEAPDFSGESPAPSLSNIDLLDDVELEVKIELGRTEMYIEDVLRLGEGSVVELDKAAGDPVDILVNDRLVARGEVLVLNDNFCVRINDILSPIPELEREK